MKIRLYTLLVLCTLLCWGCASPQHPARQVPTFVMETFLPPAVVGWAPHAQVGEGSRTERSPPSGNSSLLGSPQESLHFQFNQISPMASELGALKAHGEFLLQRPGLSAIVEGHTDEFGSNDYNLVLGVKRAQSVKDSLINMGIEGERLEVKSLGKSQPMVKGHNREAWRQNRRVDIRYLNNNPSSKE